MDEFISNDVVVWWEPKPQETKSLQIRIQVNVFGTLHGSSDRLTVIFDDGFEQAVLALFYKSNY